MLYSPQSVQNISASPGCTAIARGLSSSVEAMATRSEPSKFETSTRRVPESVQNSSSCIQSTAIPPGDSSPHLITVFTAVPFMNDIFIASVETSDQNSSPRL